MILPGSGAWRARRDVNRWLASRRARLVRLAWAWSGDPVLAEDLVQETFHRAVKARSTLRDERRVDAWMVSIMQRVYLDYLKSAKRRECPAEAQELEAELGRERLFEPDVGPERQAIDRQRARRVREAVESLPLGQRQAITLVDLEGFSYSECAEILGVPVGTVMSRLSRARTALRESLETSLGSTAPCGAVELKRVK